MFCPSGVPIMRATTSTPEPAGNGASTRTGFVGYASSVEACPEPFDGLTAGTVECAVCDHAAQSASRIATGVFMLLLPASRFERFQADASTVRAGLNCGATFV